MAYADYTNLQELDKIGRLGHYSASMDDFEAGLKR